MESSEDESRDDTKTLMEEALKILSQEGFKLPDDVVDTLHTVGRSNATARRRGSLRGHRVCEVQSNTRKVRNTRESSGKRSRNNSSSSFDDNKDPVRNGDCAEKFSRRDGRYERQESDEVFAPSDGGAQGGIVPRPRLERGESGESSSTCTTSTVRAAHGAECLQDRPTFERQDSGSSIASSASSFNRKLAQVQGRHESLGSDTGYHTSIENAKQTHEARAENLKNFNKQIDSKLSQRRNGGLRRDISRDSGFTESGFSNISHNPGTPVESVVPEPEKQIKTNTCAKHDFNDFSVHNSDVSERYLSTDAGDIHAVTSTAGDLTAGEMTSRSDKITEDGTAVSSVAKLQNQENNSTMLRVTNKSTTDSISKGEDYESVNKTSKSSRNDSISTTEDGTTTAASRHAASVEQGLYKESTKMTTGKDGQSASSEMSVDQQLVRNQHKNNIEQSDDGTSKEENKEISEKALTSKTHREERLGSDDGPMSGTLSSSQSLDSNAKTSQNEETITQADGTVVKRSNDLTTKSENEQNVTEKRTVKREPYGGGSSTELVKKSDSSSVSESSKKVSEVKESATGKSTFEESEDDKSVSSSFSGQCESTEVRDGKKLHRTTSSEKSSKSSVKSSRSVSSYSSRGNTADIPGENSSASRRLSNISDVSNVSNLSGLSRDNINPPSYEETVSNKGGSRQGSMSSVFSRQDSTGSSIASSASAFNERQRQKMLNKSSGIERQDSGETRRKELEGLSTGRGYNGRSAMRHDSYSSDSTIGGDFEEENLRQSGLINHPIRLTDSVSYGRSDTSMTKPANRRATLQGDIVLTERDINVARSDIRSSLRGRDDTYLDSGDRSYNSRATRSINRSRLDDDFGGFGTTSFKDEVMDIVDSFFDDGDEDDFGFGRRNGRHVERRNPYSTREDLSRYNVDTFDSISGRHSEPEYAASESGFPVSRGLTSRGIGGSRYARGELDFSDSVSESGHGRYAGRASLGTSDVMESSYGSKTSSALAGMRQRGGNQYQVSRMSEQTTLSEEADDILRSAGKSIHNDRTSISNRDRHSDIISRDEIGGNKAFDYKRRDENNYSKYKTGRNCAYSQEVDMGESNSAYVSRKEQESTNTQASNYRSRMGKEAGLEDARNKAKEQNGDESGKDDERKQRIGQALSWIRTELGGLRTQDKVLMSQFQRCQDSIEELKKQKPWYEVYSDDDEEDEDRYWEDGEIDDFDRANHPDRKGLGSRSSSNAGTGAND